MFGCFHHVLTHLSKEVINLIEMKIRISQCIGIGRFCEQNIPIELDGCLSPGNIWIQKTITFDRKSLGEKTQEYSKNT